MGRIKKLLSLLVFVGAVYYGWMLLPVYMANYQYQDSLAEIAKFSAMSTRTDDEIKQEVLKKAKEYDVPITAEQITVNHEGTRLDISSDYTVVVDLVGGKKAILHFTPSSKEKAVGSTPAQPKKN
jgi:YbbR domain-containing protein